LDSLDIGLQKKMGHYARDYALTQNWEAVFETLFDDYQRVADQID